MSYSNKAIVFYGYCWDSEDDDHDLRRAFLSTAGRFDEIDKLDDFDLEPTEVEGPARSGAGRERRRAGAARARGPHGEGYFVGSRPITIEEFEAL